MLRAPKRTGRSRSASALRPTGPAAPPGSAARPRSGTPGPASPGHRCPAMPAPAPTRNPTAAEPIIVEPRPITLKQRPWFTRGLLTALILLLDHRVVGRCIPVRARQGVRRRSDDQGGACVVLRGPGRRPVVSHPRCRCRRPLRLAAAGRTAGPPTPGGSAGGDRPAATSERHRCRPRRWHPAGALPKGGTVPAGVGGLISGRGGRSSGRTGGPDHRHRDPGSRRRHDNGEASAATQADGTYEVAGLFPADYVLRFSADGFTTSASSRQPRREKAATRVPATSAQVTTSTNAVITGKPAKITGSIDSGNTTERPPPPSPSA